MGVSSVEKIRNIVLLSHSGVGKTSLTDMLAYKTGFADRLGKPEDKTSLSDYDDEEKKRGISINSAIFSLDKGEYRLNFIDTPGYLEFIGEVVCGIRASDIGMVLIDASNGIEIGTERVWELLDEFNMPRVILINKLDSDNINFESLIENIRNRFGSECVLFQIPDNISSNYKKSTSLLEENPETDLSIDISGYKQELIENIAESKDDLLEEYLEKGSLEKEKLEDGVKWAIANKNIVPIFCGSIKNEKFVEDLIEYIIKFFPSPNQVKTLQAKDNNEDFNVKAKEDEPFLAQIFKTVIDPYVGQLSIFRIFSGSLTCNSQIYNSNNGTTEKLGQLYLLQGKSQKDVDKVLAGEIFAAAKLKNANVSDTFSDSSKKIQFPDMKFPEPALSISISPQSREDEQKISEALKKLAKEDKTFRVTRDTQTKELIVSGMGSLHLEIMVDKLKQRFGVDVEVGTPKVPYKETISTTVEVHQKYKKQSGGRGQYGDVWLRLVPLERDKGFEFEDQITGGAIPKQYIPAVEKGVKNAMEKGVLSGCPLVDIKAVLYDGSYHSVDSSDMAFQIAGSMALKEAAIKAKPILLEPIMDVSIFVEEEFMGQINKDLSSRRGRIIGMEAKGSIQVVNAEVPLSEMLQYASELKSMTGGRGSFSMKFARYEQVPHKITEKIISEKQSAKQE